MKSTTGPLVGPPLQRILVATDLSGGADRALKRAGLLPLAGTAKIHLVHVDGDDERRGSPRAVRQIRAALREEAKRLKASLAGRGRPGVSIQVELLHGRPFEEISRHAERQRAELIVLGRHGAGGLASLLIGSTAERVVRSRRRPVLVVNGPARRPYARPLVAADVGSDFVPVVHLAMRLLAAGIRWLDVLSAYQVLHERSMLVHGASPAAVRDLRAQHAAHNLSILNDRLTERMPEGTRLRPIVKRGDPRRVIRDTIERRESDLVALGTNSRGLQRFLLGSVAVEVLRSVTVDVLIVP